MSAFDRINDSLDVLTIIKNFNILKVLDNLIFEPRHHELTQYLGYDLWKADRDLKLKEKEAFEEAEKKKPKKDKKPTNVALQEERVRVERQRFADALDEIREVPPDNLSQAITLQQYLQCMTDHYFRVRLLGVQNKEDDIVAPHLG